MESERTFATYPGIVAELEAAHGTEHTEDLMQRAADEIKRQHGMNEMLRESVSHLRCKHCGDNDTVPEHPAGGCAECDLWR